MKTRNKIFILAFLLCSLTTLFIPAFATNATFKDIPQQSRYYQSVEYLYQNKITFGVGGDLYDAASPITERQLIVMICRAKKLEDTLQKDAKYNFGDYCITYAFQQKWIDEHGLLYPDIKLTYAELLKVVFKAFDYPAYPSYLYDREQLLNENDNLTYLARTSQITDISYKSSELATRGEAAIILYSILTSKYKIILPPILSKIDIQYFKNNIPEDYVIELYRVPRRILKDFAQRKWTLSIQGAYLYEAEARDGKNYGGLTSHAQKTIYLDTASSTLHEFGHFLNNALDFPYIMNIYYNQEKDFSYGILRDYSRTTSGEYFADVFVYFVNNKSNTEAMKKMQEKMPQTYHYFEVLRLQGLFD